MRPMGTIELRAPRTDELAAVCALVNRAEQHDRIPRQLELVELEEEFSHLSIDDDVRIATVDGELAGYTYVLHLPSDVREERGYVFGTVDPSMRGRGVGTALLQWGRGRVAELLLASGNALTKYVRVDAYDFVGAAHQLFASIGFEPVRYMDELLRPLDVLPTVPEIDGVRIVPLPDDRDEDVRVAKNTAFADHWGSTPTTPDHWQQSLRGYGSAPQMSFVALDSDDAVVSMLISHRYEADDAITGRRDAWVATLGTLREWRGKGLGSALIATALHAYAAAGMTHASIGVDSENPTGAAQLYRKLGFEPSTRMIVHQIVIA